jgi:hypothetical protein
MSGASILGGAAVNRPLPSVEVAAFLMVLEIERLLAENEKQKHRLSEIEDKLLDRNSYE